MWTLFEKNIFSLTISDIFAVFFLSIVKKRKHGGVITNLHAFMAES